MVRHLAGCVRYDWHFVELMSRACTTTIRVWCDVDVMNSRTGDCIVFEAALSDCEACLASRSRALHQVKPEAATPPSEPRT